MEARYKWACRIMAAALAALIPLPALAVEDYAVTRSETVYVDMDAYGAPQSVVSSVYISNPGEAQTVRDRTTLTDIKNVLGKDKPEAKGDTLTFRADGDDVCYQGTAAGELPVTAEISYTLNDQPISAEALAGKSGRVGIAVKTTNRVAQSTVVDGETVELYTPFSVICMLNLNERFSYIETDHGKISAEAGAVSVLSVLHPGLRESLGAEELESIHDDLHLTAQVENFELDSITFIVMTGIVSESDLTSANDLQDMLDGIRELTDAADELYDGTGELRDGVREFVDGLSEFRDGVKDLRKGVNRYVDGMATYYTGTVDLAKGLWEARGGTVELADGIHTMAEQSKNITIDSSAHITQAQVSQIIRDTLYSPEVQYTLGQAGITTAQMPAVAAAMGAVAQPLLTAQGKLTEQTVKGMLSQFVAALGQLDEGARCLNGGMLQLAVGANKLADGGMDMVVGGNELLDGVEELYDGAEELYDGAEELYDGTGDLQDGIGEMRDDGLQKMVDETAELNVSLTRKDALVALGEAYTSFSCTDPSVKGSVQFIMTSAEIVAEKPIETEAGEGTEKASAEVEVVEGKVKEGSWFSRAWNAVKGWFGAK